jgi:hypothetical protein
MVDHCGGVGGVMVHVVTIGHLARAAVAAAIDADHPVALLNKKQHLGIPVVSTKRPAVMEHNGLTLAPVLVEDLDAVLGCNHAHGLASRVE